MSLGEGWFTERCDECGTAFSIKVRGKLHDEQSRYQHIEVYETERLGNLLVIDGFVMLTSRDNFMYHEMMTHSALFTHPHPKKVLIIGGGDCGCLLEVLKHPGVEKADLVDIDERVTRVCEKFFPELCESNDDPRANLNFTDGIKWAKEATPGSYDIVIIDSTDPIGQAARLFSEEFYRFCFAALSRKGVLIAQSESPLFHADLIKTMQHRMREAGFPKTSTLYFPQCTYPSGWWTASMACKDVSLAGFREQDAANKTFMTRYYNAAVHQGALATPEFMQAALL